MNTRSAVALFGLMVSPTLVFATDNASSAQSLQSKVDALVAELVVCPWRPQRFVDNGDGTLCDTRTGLMWEKKNAADGVQDLSNPHDVDNLYTWRSSGGPNVTDRDGTLYADFIAKLNGAVAHFVESEQLGSYRDWRVPTLAELQTLLAEPCPGSAVRRPSGFSAGGQVPVLDIDRVAGRFHRHELCVGSLLQRRRRDRRG